MTLIMQNTCPYDESASCKLSGNCWGPSTFHGRHQLRNRLGNRRHVRSNTWTTELRSGSEHFHRGFRGKANIDDFESFSNSATSSFFRIHPKKIRVKNQKVMKNRCLTLNRVSTQIWLLAIR